MKRIHMGVVVEDFEKSLKFYTDLFDAEPTLQKDGYARWMLDDPRVNFNINVQGPAPGIDHVGIGSDYDGVGDSLPDGLKDVSTYPALIKGLLERGYSEADVKKILSGNLLRVWRAVEARAEG